MPVQVEEDIHIQPGRDLPLFQLPELLRGDMQDLGHPAAGEMVLLPQGDDIVNEILELDVVIGNDVHVINPPSYIF